MTQINIKLKFLSWVEPNKTVKKKKKKNVAIIWKYVILAITHYIKCL